MRRVPPLFFVALGVAAACTYGSYDGKGYDGGVDAGTEGGSGRVVLSRTLEPGKDEVLVTPDGAFELTIPKGAFSTATPVTIAQLEDRTVDALIVPTYRVTVAVSPSLPVQVVFRGNNPNGGNLSRLLLPATQRPDTSFAPLTMVGVGSGGGVSNTYWGLTKELGTFSLVFESASPSRSFLDNSAVSCIAKCCVGGSTGTGTANAVSLGGGTCACAGAPNLACFLESCPDLAAVAARCTDLGTNNPPDNVDCRPFAALGAQNCPGPGCNGYPGQCSSGSGSAICCVANKSGSCAMGPSGTCSGIAIRCDLDTKCPAGTTCCAFESDAYCTASCPAGRHLCQKDSDCDGGAPTDGGSDGGICQIAPSCPFRTCGKPPAACQ